MWVRNMTCRWAGEGRCTVQALTHDQSTPLPTPKPEVRRSHPVEERVYQAMTLGAILLVLGSVWLF